MLCFDVMRHGQTTLLANGHVLRGRTDDPLTDLGHRQMTQTFLDNFDPTWQAIISSPLLRCRAFASEQAKRCGLPLFVQDDWQELDFGDWEGQDSADLYAKFPDELGLYWQSPHLFTPPNAESVEVFFERISRACAQLATLCHEQGFGRVLIICHGGVIKMLTVQARSLPLEMLMSVPCELATLHRFGYDNGCLC